MSVTARALNISVFQLMSCLEVRPFLDELTLQLATNSTLIQCGQAELETAKMPERAHREDVRESTVLHDVLISQQNLDKAANCQKCEAWCL